MRDEMIFTCILLMITIVVIAYIIFVFNQFISLNREYFDDVFIFNVRVFYKATEETISIFCQDAVPYLISLRDFLDIFRVLMVVNVLGFSTTLF